ncbi:NPCBM/NEW2 domain-containing protein [Nocardia fluminea]|uniref:NPCBM/NEW2 domain-containing protein n=1 Tax=Nocardia fluminea TaxID=134984 RepID=UPI0037BBB82F
MSTDLVVPGANGAGDGERLIIAADTVEMFLALLRRMVEYSGRTRGQIVSVSGLPRSTVYHFTSEKNTSLPKSREQVRALARACKLDAEQVDQVLEIWDGLAREEYEAGRPPAPVSKALTFTVDDSNSFAFASGKFIVEQRHILRLYRRIVISTAVTALLLVFTIIFAVVALINAQNARERAAASLQQVIPPLDGGGEWAGLPEGGSWYSLTDFRPKSTTSSGTGQIMVRGLSYPTALITRPTSSASASTTYALSRSCVAFSTMVAADDRSLDQTGRNAVSWFGVRTDDRSATAAYRGSGDEPITMSMSVRGVDELTLEADTRFDQALGAWIGARVYCTAPPGQPV